MRYDIGDADARRKQERFVARREQPIGKAGAVDGPPESVCWAREMMTDRSGVEARVDAAEKHSQARRYQIRNGLAASGAERLRGRALWTRGDGTAPHEARDTAFAST